MSKMIIFDKEARQRIKKGVDTLANAVKVTLGPQGRNVIIEREYGTPYVTKDGVSVAKEITLNDPIENMGAEMVKEVASKTASIAGDGTTTSTVLAQAIIEEAMTYLEAGSNPMDIKRGIDKATTVALDNIASNSEQIKNTSEQIEQIATISANGDVQIGKMIADAFAQIGAEGVITIDEAPGTETTLKVVEGMQFDRGYISPYFITNEKMQAELHNPYILLTDKKITAIKDILGILEMVSEKSGSMVIICDDLDGEALATLIANKIRGNISVAAVKAPEFGNLRKEAFTDLAVLTGAKLMSEETGDKLELADLSSLGRCSLITIGKDSTTIVGGTGTAEAITEHISKIKEAVKSITSDYDKEKAQQRIAKLSGGIGVLYVGGVTEVEMKERKDRMDDALHATKAAMEEGIVAGGGCAYITAAEAVELNFDMATTEGEKAGMRILMNSLSAPTFTIATNAGFNGKDIVDLIIDNKLGFNAKTGEFENLIKAGIIDPAKVSRVALENAASIAGLLLTTECVIAREKTTDIQPLNY